MRRSVDEVSVRHERSRDAHHGAVESHDEDLGMVREGVRQTQIECHKALEPLLMSLLGILGSGARDGKVRSTVCVC